ncbi:MAG: ABC-F family ATP-binding cassette domain-containing protein, partial [Vallitaleaceae bacterium]|nr:ABC-F family ATP-binding cassette domain-containing protein [Vallitaleaceae bacterium]
MTLLTIENISKSYGERILFENATFTINDTDKIGFIGINGTGKSTLLKIIAGFETTDTGIVSYSKGMTIEYLPQNPVYDFEATILEQVFKGNSEAMKLMRNYENTLEAIDLDPNSEKLQEQLLKYTNEMKTMDLWDLESQVKTILTKLGISNFHQKMSQLSGGLKKRVALASALIAPCDLLILDEPTNHMDNTTIDWLEGYLEARKGGLLMITHDRYFLDRVVTRTIELDNGSLYSYPGNYSLFVEKKIERQQIETGLERKRLNLYRNELEWMRRGAKARTTKQKARIQRFDAIENANFAPSEEKMAISVAHSRLGNKIIEMSNLSKSYTNKPLIKRFSYVVLRDDRIGIIGDNGIGKSTLLNLITGKLTPDEGTIEQGTTVKIGYFSQESEDMPTGMRAIEYIKDAAEFITTADGSRLSASQLMETFLFTGDQQWTTISRLSGGERRRLYLLKILMSEPNILILDEPTNDLDIDTLKILESYMDDFRGAVITVSHDRYFLDRTCKKIFAFEGEGKITEYAGNYSDYLLHKPEDLVFTPIKKMAEKPSSDDVKPKKPKFTFAEKSEFDGIDLEIAKLEEQLLNVEKALVTHSTDFVRLQELSEEKNSLEDT